MNTKERLVELAKEMASTDYGKDSGITVSDIRVEAIKRDILTGKETGRELSYLSSIPKRAGLINLGETARSRIPSTHGNLQMVWYARRPEIC